MATIFKRIKGSIDYYSAKAVEPPKKDLDHLTAVSHLFTDEEFATKLAMLNQQADNGDAVENSFETLSAISTRYDLLAPLARDTRNAQIEMAVSLLNEKVSDVDTHVEAIKKATGEGWPKIRLWCDQPAPGGAGTKKTGKVRVPTDVVRTIDAKVQAAKDEAERRRKTAEENKRKNGA